MAAEVGEILYPEEDGEVETGFPIAILAEKSCSELAAVLASIYAGSFYVCINPEQTESRITSILNVLEPRLVIVEDKQTEKLSRAGYDGKTLSLDALVEKAKAGNTSEAAMMKLMKIRREIRSTDPLYCIFTSGST